MIAVNTHHSRIHATTPADATATATLPTPSEVITTIQRCDDDATLSALAERLEHDGRLREARALYERAASMSPQGAVHARRRLAALLEDSGEPQAAAQVLESLVTHQADDPETWHALARLHRDAGDPHRARDALARALAGSGDHAVPALAELDAEIAAARGAPGIAADADEFEPLLHGLVERFVGRRGVHAVQWADAQTGRSGYAPCWEPFGLDHARSHLLGDRTVGIYLVESDHTVRAGVLDVDVLGTRGGTITPTQRDAARAVACRLADAARRLDLPLLLEDSGGRGFHAWLLLSAPTPARTVRRALKAIMTRAGTPPEEVGIEIFPKQDQVAPGALGNLIKLPLGVHAVSGRRCPLLTDDGQSAPSQAAALAAAPAISPEAVEQVASLPAPTPASVSLPSPSLTGAASPAGGTPAAATPMVFDELPARVVAGCAVVRALVEKAETTGHLSHNERVVLLYTLGPLGEAGHRALHTVIKRCRDYDPKVTERQIRSLRPNAMSCRKVRERLPELSDKVGCACDFDLNAGCYASPVCHADQALARLRGAARHRSASGRQIKEPTTPDTRVRRYLAVKQSLLRLTGELGRLEEELAQDLLATGEDELATPSGRLMPTGDDVATWPAPRFRIEV